MIRCLVLLFGWLLTLSTVWAQGQPFPDGPEPQIVLVKAGKDGKLGIVRRVTQYVPEERIRVEVRTEIVDGKQVNREVPVTYTVMTVAFQLSKQFVERDSFRVVDIAGKPYNPEQLEKRLAKSTVALVLNGQTKLDPFYAQLYRPDIPVILLLPPKPNPQFAPDKPVDADDGGPF